MNMYEPIYSHIVVPFLEATSGFVHHLPSVDKKCQGYIFICGIRQSQSRFQNEV